jgi:NAD(P)-dependent dehydrogenase (short-subunit alcohol dehydrogenase family)
VVLVTGAAGALGTAVAELFAGRGATLALMDADAEALQARHAGAYVQRLVVDLTNPQAIEEAVAEVLSRQGRVDVLVNCAGGFAMGPRVHETELAAWHRMLDMNLHSVFLMSRAVLPHMLSQGQGRIVNVAARVANAGKGRMAAYSVAKGGVARLTESLAAEYRGDGINVNCVMPGTLDTPANRRDMPDADFASWVSTRDLAEVIAFLCSDAARAVHGAVMPVYGLT